MKPLNDYVIIEPIVEDKKTSFKVEEEEPSLLVGKVINQGDESKGLLDKNVLFKKHLFDEYKGKYIGKVENIIAVVYEL